MPPHFLSVHSSIKRLMPQARTAYGTRFAKSLTKCGRVFGTRHVRFVQPDGAPPSAHSNATNRRTDGDLVSGRCKPQRLGSTGKNNDESEKLAEATRRCCCGICTGTSRAATDSVRHYRVRTCDVRPSRHHKRKPGRCARGDCSQNAESDNNRHTDGRSQLLPKPPDQFGQHVSPYCLRSVGPRWKFWYATHCHCHIQIHWTGFGFVDRSVQQAANVDGYYCHEQ
ncbi:hypothetical protein BLA18110_00144 [Burkholderia lata]|nr:hypothetical protein BLA18110_00144 [Burkholderia lata]